VNGPPRKIWLTIVANTGAGPVVQPGRLFRKTLNLPDKDSGDRDLTHIHEGDIMKKHLRFRRSALETGVVLFISTAGLTAVSAQAPSSTSSNSSSQITANDLKLRMSKLPSSWKAAPSIAGCPGYSQCPLVNFQEAILFDPTVRALNAFITQTENKTVNQIVTGNFPPADASSILGKVMIYDRALSVNGLVACATCHLPQAGFQSMGSLFNAAMTDDPGAIGMRVGNRKPMSYGYAPFAPILHFRASTGDFVGGNFWDGRATGNVTGNPAGDQALGPPLNPLEMANPDAACVVRSLSQAPYRGLFESVWGVQSFNIVFPANTEKLCAQPATVQSGTVLKLSAQDRAQVNKTFDNFGRSIKDYEAGPEVSPFTSKFDFFLKGEATLTTIEQQGLDLFNGKGLCNQCHLSAGKKPLFTDFTFINEGIPQNKANPFLYQDRPDTFGFVGNPLGPSYIDFGLGAILPTIPAFAKFAPQFEGTFQVSTLRNISETPLAFRGFVKNFMHNGLFKDLKSVVHWYNTAGALPTCAASLGSAIGGQVGRTCWPAPEVLQNINRTQMGNLGLTSQEENAIVAFMRTLKDGFKPTPPTSSPATQ
jgi:cytochrome c peroxidase